MIGCGLALVIAGGIWQGQLQSAPAAKAVDLSSIPQQLGDWTSTDFELPARDIQAAGIESGYLARRYVHAESGEGITVLLVSGAGGPISVHPPEVCFAGQGYLKESVIVPIRTPSLENGRDHQFSMAIFRGPESTGGTRVQLFWSWSDSGIWQTPSNPRLAFARLPRLYKLYVSRTIGPNQGREDVKNCLDFLSLLLPEFETLMSPPKDNSSTPAEPQPAGEPEETVLVQPPLHLFAPSRFVRRNALHFARPMLAQSPVIDGDFRL